MEGWSGRGRALLMRHGMVSWMQATTETDIATDAGTLLQTLSNPMLATQAHMQPGLYIAEINPDGYLGRVLLRFERN